MNSILIRTFGMRIYKQGKAKKSWARVKGIWQEDDLLVFVDYEIKEIGTPPDFYVFDVPAWKKIVTHKKRMFQGLPSTE